MKSKRQYMKSSFKIFYYLVSTLAVGWYGFEVFNLIDFHTKNALIAQAASFLLLADLVNGCLEIIGVACIWKNRINLFLAVQVIIAVFILFCFICYKSYSQDLFTILVLVKSIVFFAIVFYRKQRLSK